jgi:hypothetical protein
MLYNPFVSGGFSFCTFLPWAAHRPLTETTCAYTHVFWLRPWKLSVTCGRSVVFSGSSTNKTDRHNITETLLKVALNTIKPTNQPLKVHKCICNLKLQSQVHAIKVCIQIGRKLFNWKLTRICITIRVCHN